jgi:hypothetical protein
MGPHPATGIALHFLTFMFPSTPRTDPTIHQFKRGNVYNRVSAIKTAVSLLYHIEEFNKDDMKLSQLGAYEFYLP